MRLKNKQYFQLKLTADTDEEAINPFLSFVIKDLMLLALILIQGSWNIWSIMFTILLGRDLFIIGRYTGASDAQRSKRMAVKKELV